MEEKLKVWSEEKREREESKKHMLYKLKISLFGTLEYTRKKKRKIEKKKEYRIESIYDYK